MTLEFQLPLLIFFSIIDVYAIYYLLSNTLTFRFSKDKTIPVYIGAYIYYILIQIVFVLIHNSPLKIILMFSLWAIFVMIHKDSIYKRLLWTASAYLLMGLCELACMPFTLMITHVPFEEVLQTNSSYCVGMCISRAFLLIIVNILVRSKYGKKKFFKGFTKEIFVIILIDFIYMILISNLYYYNAVVLDMDTTIALSIFVLIIISVISIYLLQKVTRKSDEIMNTTLKLQQAEMEHKLTSDMTSVVENLRSLRHDMNNHMSILQGLLSVKAYDDMADYLNSITQELSVANNFYFPENKVLSVLLNSKISQASQIGITFDTEISTSSTPFSEKDLCTLLGNILENAIEASSTHEKPSICFKMYKEENQLHIQCDNTFTTAPIFENGKLITTKENKTTHGIGTQNICSVVEAYHGTIQFSVDEQFHVTITIPLPVYYQ